MPAIDPCCEQGKAYLEIIPGRRLLRPVYLEINALFGQDTFGITDLSSDERSSDNFSLSWVEKQHDVGDASVRGQVP
jgi:hypothetical protein